MAEDRAEIPWPTLVRRPHAATAFDGTPYYDEELGVAQSTAHRILVLGAVAAGFSSAAAGTLGGVVVGGGIALVLIEVVNRQSFHWSMDYRVPIASLTVFMLALIALAALAALIAGRQAMQGDAILSVREDW